MKSLLKKIEKMFPPSINGVATLIIYTDGSGMIIRLGAKNIRMSVYDIPELLEFHSLDDLMEQLK